MPMRPFPRARVAAQALSVALAALLFAAPPASGQNRLAPDEASAAALDDFRVHLERMSRDGSWWWTSNDAYREADGAAGADAYGVRFWPDPGELSASGCLWAIREGSPPAVVWTFHEGWDPVAGRAFVYQSHTSGAGAGMGHRMEPSQGAGVVEQDFRWSDGSTQRIRHEVRWPDDDVHVGASLTWADGAWVADRSYTWERRSGGDMPCGPVTP